MPLKEGTRLGGYEVLAPLGAGGMGEVYRARDTKLDREVALKVLPQDLALDSDALARFEREAKAVAALSHPGILAIFDFGRADGLAYAVTELLDGDTLRVKLADGPLPARKAVDYGAQIARALAAAHEKGIVHRDLKPENLFVTRDGRVKVLDFGLARHVPFAAAGGDTRSPTVSRHTDPGTVLGTVGYMSPEQVKGKPADHRSDIFSFGAVLYEMVSGRRAFRGDTAVETMNAILKEDAPDLDQTRPGLPSGIDRIVRHCLEKSPHERFQSARDLAFDLETTGGVSTPSAPQAAPGGTPARWWLIRSVLALGLVGLGAAGSLLALRARPTPPPTFKRLTFQRGSVEAARFVPGSRNVVYTARWRGEPAALFSVHPDNLESRALSASGSLLAVSPSEELAMRLRGRELNRAVRGTLARLQMGGGGAREVREDVIYADWSPDGKQLAILTEDDREVHRLEFPVGRILLETPNRVWAMRLSPAADRVAFIEDVPASDGSGQAVRVVDLASARTTLARTLRSTGLAWRGEGELWLSEYDEGGYTNLWSVRLSGRRRLVWRAAGSFWIQDIDRDGRVLLDLRHQQSGLFARAPGTSREADLSWLDQMSVSDVSADGSTVIVDTYGATAVREGAVYLVRSGAAPVRLGTGGGGRLSPDGRWVAEFFESTTEARLLPTGPGEPKRVSLTGLSDWLGFWFFPDGRRLLIEGRQPGRPLRFFEVGLEGGAPRALTPEGTEAYVSQNVLSPDGSVIAAVCEDNEVRLYPVRGGAPVLVRGRDRYDVVLAWTVDGRGLYLFDREGLPARIFVLDLATGRKTLWREIAPSDPAGVARISNILIRPDGRAYAYSFVRSLSELYLVEGLQ
jgi:eukaryotic-like serine/threonine-protein kinase